MAEERTGAEIDEILKDLVPKMERVRILYEQYFMGIERTEPLVARKDVQRKMIDLQQQQIRNTGLRFRFNTMLQKWNIYITHWNRILREIENGTYVRHVYKAARAAAREGKELPPEMLTPQLRRRSDETPVPVAKPVEVEAVTGPVPKAAAAPATPARAVTTTPPPRPAASTPPPTPPRAPSPPPLPPGAQRPPPTPPPRAQVATPSPPPPRVQVATPSPPPPRAQIATPPPAPSPPAAPKPAGPVPGMDEAELRALHQRLVDARRSTGEKGRVTYEGLVASLSQQASKVLTRPGIGAVRFDVAVENGKAVVKSIPERAAKK